MRPRTVLSMEQALSLPYATMRFVQLATRAVLADMRREDFAPENPNPEATDAFTRQLNPLSRLDFSQQGRRPEGRRAVGQ